MSFFKRLFGKKDRPAADEAPVVEEAPLVEEQLRWPASPDHFAIIEAPAPPPAEEPLAEPQPTVESPALTADDLTFSSEPEPEPEPEEEAFLEPQVAVEEPVATPAAPEPEPSGEITVARMAEAEVLAVLEQALDELGSAHHRPFSRG